MSQHDTFVGGPLTVGEIPRGILEVAAQSRCSLCLAGDKIVGWHHGRVVHRAKAINEGYYHRACLNYDAEGRHIAEPLGFYTFAWLPVRCRNGKWRWFRWVERHEDGTFTAGNRAF